MLHNQAHEAQTESRKDLRIARGLWLRSLRLGLSGRADVVEFEHVDKSQQGILLSGAEGLWKPFPVEYKRGRLRSEESFEVQLCAQALCLEEMLGIEIPCGALYYGKTRRRLELPLDKNIRDKTENAASRLHELISRGLTPAAKPEEKCKFCSLHEVCLPEAMNRRKNVKSYIERAISLAEQQA